MSGVADQSEFVQYCGLVVQGRTGESEMRIVSGRFRSRKLLTNIGKTTRPMPDRVKETLFEHLKEVIPGKRVADVFAGTGTIGLEALSRGAKSVVFIENDRRALELLKRNVTAFGLEKETLCWGTDALRSSYRPVGMDEFLPYDVVFFDPPFRMIERFRSEGTLTKAWQRLARPGVTAADALLVVRTPDRPNFEMSMGWEETHHWFFSRMEIFAYRKGVADSRTAGAEGEMLDRGEVGDI